MQTLLYKGQIRSCHKIVISYQDFLILDVWIVWPVTSPWAGAWGCRSRRPRWPSARPGHCRTAPAPGRALQVMLFSHRSKDILDVLSFHALIMCDNCTQLVLRNVWSCSQVWNSDTYTYSLPPPTCQPPPGPRTTLGLLVDVDAARTPLLRSLRQHVPAAQHGPWGHLGVTRTRTLTWRRSGSWSSSGTETSSGTTPPAAPLK